MFEEEKSSLKYKYILLAVLAIIIALLIIFIVVVKVNIDKQKRIEEIREAEAQQEALRIELERQKKEEEERLAKEREKEEENNATGVIYLTFDDGPSLDITPNILDILENKNVKATFFVLHYGEKNEEILKRENELGEAIGLHGFTHTYSEVYQSADSCLENFKKIQDQVYETIGIRPNIIRFPGGSSNTVSKKYCEGVMTEVTNRALDEGFKYFDWNVDSEDSGSARTSDDVYNNVISHLKPR